MPAGALSRATGPAGDGAGRSSPTGSVLRVKILVPSRVLVDVEAEKVSAEAPGGFFCLLPRHVDFVSALSRGGLVTLALPDGAELYVAVDEGILVKCGREVLVSATSAVHGDDLDRLRSEAERRFSELHEQESKTRTGLARLEADLVRRFYELGMDGRL